MLTYANKFRNCVATRLGGQEMAEEFFRFHPAIFGEMRLASLYHRTKGGAAWKGAAIFFRQVIKPSLKADREMAKTMPLLPPINIDDAIDGRR
jgi:hypothetical protein